MWFTEVMVFQENVQRGQFWEGQGCEQGCQTPCTRPLPSLRPHPGPFIHIWAQAVGPQKRESYFMCCCTVSGRRSVDEGKALGTRCWHHGCVPLTRCRESAVGQGVLQSQQVQQPVLVSPMGVRALRAEAWSTRRVLRDAHPHLFSLDI